MEYHNGTKLEIPYATLLLLGDSGVGKTKLASQMPHPFFLDIEGGAFHTGAPLFTFVKQGSSYNTILEVLRTLARLKVGPDGFLHWKPHGAKEELTIGTIVLDTMDELQSIVDKTISRTGMQYWGEMLKKMKDVCDLARCCLCHRVFISHGKEYRPSEEDAKKYGVVPEVGLGLQGAIRDKLPDWVDVSLNLVKRQDGTRVLIPEQQIVNGRSYYAKDRYHLYGGQTFDVVFDKAGQVQGGLMDRVLAICTGGSSQDHDAALVADVKKQWIERAVKAGVMQNPKDQAGANKLIQQLGHLYADLNGENAEDFLAEGLAVIEAMEVIQDIPGAEVSAPDPDQEEEPVAGEEQ